MFSFNNLTVIPTDDFFYNVSEIKRLDLSSNGLQWISPEGFVPMTMLKWLCLDNNDLVSKSTKIGFLIKRFGDCHPEAYEYDFFY